MKTAMLWTLIVLNVALAATMIGRYTKPNVAEAQVRRAGEYLTIPVDFVGPPAGVVVVLDSTSGELSAIITDENAKRMSAMQPINLIQMFDKTAAQAPRRR